MKFLRLVSLLSTAVLAFGGECLQDSNTNQPASAWNQRLWSYSPASAAPISTSSTLSFMSYNLQSSISNACVSNPQAQASFMTTDYVGNQEVVQGVDTRCNCNMPKIIADTTGKSTRYVMTFPWRTGQYGIQAGTSQTIVDTQYFLYTAAGEQRALVALKTLPPGLNGKPLWFIATHLDYDIPAARLAQAQQLVQWVRTNIIAADSTASVVVVGDFNDSPWGSYYNVMKGLFKNSWEVFSGGIDGGFTYPSPGPTIRFDNVWYYTPSSVSASVQSVEVVNTQDSDHRPLKATIKFTTSGSAPSTPATVAPTVAPTKGATSAPTSAPTKAATNAPTQAPTQAPAASGTCAVTTSFDSTNHNIVIRNTGSKAVKTLELSFSPSLPSNNWNLVAASSANTYTIPAWAFGSLTAGASYTGSGFYTTSGVPTITVTRISC